MAVLFFTLPGHTAPDSTARPPLWITAYYPGWEQQKMPPHEIDFAAVTHLVHFSVMPLPDGTLDFGQHGLTTERSKAVADAAHGAGRKVLLCVGGAKTATGFRGAMQAGTRAAFINALIQETRSRGYDGLDVDMEPIESSDQVPYSDFVRELREAMRKTNPNWLLTCAVSDQPVLFKSLQDEFDQINVMTYDLSGTWEGWVTWHNSALHSGGAKFPTVERKLPTIQTSVQRYLDAGIPASKLGIGVAFYGVLWHGATAPQQSIEGVTTSTISHANMMRKYFAPDRLRWDMTAQAAYLSIEGKERKDNLFISFDDEQACRLKIEWAKQANLGGAIIWQIGGDYRPEPPKPQRNPLLQAVKSAAFGE